MPSPPSPTNALPASKRARVAEAAAADVRADETTSNALNEEKPDGSTVAMESNFRSRKAVQARAAVRRADFVSRTRNELDEALKPTRVVELDLDDLL